MRGCLAAGFPFLFRNIYSGMSHDVLGAELLIRQLRKENREFVDA